MPLDPVGSSALARGACDTPLGFGWSLVLVRGPEAECYVCARPLGAAAGGSAALIGDRGFGVCVSLAQVDSYSRLSGSAKAAAEKRLSRLPIAKTDFSDDRASPPFSPGDYTLIG